MVTRSTRNKIRFQAEKAIKDCDRMSGHLKYLDELSGGQSEYVTTYLPNIVILISQLASLLTRFRKGL